MSARSSYTPSRRWQRRHGPTSPSHRRWRRRHDPIFPSLTPSPRGRSSSESGFDPPRERDPILANPSPRGTQGSPRQPSLPSSPERASQVQHLEACTCYEPWEHLEDLKTTAIAWYRACKSTTENVLWVSVHLFLVDAIKSRRTTLETTVCTCGSWPTRVPDSSHSSQSSYNSGSSYGS